MPKNPTPSAPVIAEPSIELKRLHELCSLNATACKDLSLLHARLEREWLALINRHKTEIIDLEEVKKITLAGIEDLTRQHMEWLGEKRSLRTPFGVIEFRVTKSLEIGNPDRTVNKIFARGMRVEGFDASLFTTTETKPDKQALKKLPEDVLERLGVVVVEGDSFSFEPLVVDLKKSLEASAPSPDQQAA